MTPLPIDSFLPQIAQSLRKSRALVLVAPPGAGKTTRVPPAMLQAGLLPQENPNLVMLQPRRVAARTVAARIAAEQHWTLGEQVGYHVRFDRMLRPHTRLRVLTEGILTRQLLDDPFLPGVGAVLLDEFHERSIHTDLAVALLREVQQTVRPDLILVVMSATLQAEPAAAFLGDCPILRATGRTYPVEITYQPQSLVMSDAVPDRVADAVIQAVQILPAESGDVLAFLPGAEEIRRAQRLLEPAAQRHDLLVLPLYGALPADQQDLALRPAARRKVILATNIAETSLTIDGVRTVIDSGLARVASYDAGRGLDRLDLQPISAASAEQRAGRAGRTAPGRCVRLWSQKQQHQLIPFDVPDIARVDLAPAVLSLHAWGKPQVRAFGWYQPPPEAALAAAERLLHLLGAVAGEGGAARLTPLGRRMADLPAHPRLARLLIAASDAGHAEPGAALAALLAEKDILLRPRGDGRDRTPSTAGQSDLLRRLELLNELERRRFGDAGEDVDVTAARQVARARDDLLRSIGGRGASAAAGDNDESLLRLPLAAYPDRVCKRRENDPSAGVMVGGGGVRLAAESCVRRGELFLALDVRHDPRGRSGERLVRVASAIRSEWLAEMFPQSVRTERAAEYDAERRRVVGVVRQWYLDLLLGEERHAAVDANAAGAALAAALRPQAAEIFHTNAAAAAVLARVALLRTHLPQPADQPQWPEFSDEQLGDVLAEACAGRRSMDEVLSATPLEQLLLAQLPYPLDRQLEQQAPPALEVPSGSRIRLDYQPSLRGEPPVLAVRLQELFGGPSTPTVAGGRVRVRLHLLGPNYRPVQITDDLASFWANTYVQVRKDLRARYPKHSWPEDPLKAEPQAKGRPRGSVGRV